MHLGPLRTDLSSDRAAGQAEPRCDPVRPVQLGCTEFDFSSTRKPVRTMENCFPFPLLSAMVNKVSLWFMCEWVVGDE